MNPLLLYFKEDSVELWSSDINGRLQPVLFNSSNILPLYFLISGDQILMDEFAKQSFHNGTPDSYGDFWNNLTSESIYYERFKTSNLFASLLPYAFKETILPSIAKSHFNTNLTTVLNRSNVGILFDSFVDDDHKEIILNLFFKIVGFDPNTLFSIDFFECFRDLIHNKKLINHADSFLLTNISDGNIYFHLIGRNSPSHLGKKVLVGKGHDPVLDILLDFLVEIALAKGSMTNAIELKKEFKKDAITIHNKISDGLVIHTIRNPKIDVCPLKICFHKNDIEARINNRQSLNFIQYEFDSFVRQNNAELLPIFLSGKVINELVFRDFFSSIYSKVIFENDGFDKEFTLYCLNKIAANESSSVAPVPVVPPLPSRSTIVASTSRPSAPPLPTALKKTQGQELNSVGSKVTKKELLNDISLNNKVLSSPPIIKPDLKLPPGVNKSSSDIPSSKLNPPPPPPPPPIKRNK